MTLYYEKPEILSKIPKAAHAVIEASAGTGKTYTIMHLVLDLILTAECTIDQILVVTFTEKATAELRNRVRALLEKVARLEESTSPAKAGWKIDDDARGRLREALFAFDRAPIHTIHGFCRRILSEMAFDSGVRFGLDLTDGREAFNHAYRTELRETLARETAPRALLEEWLGASKAEDLEDLLYMAYDRGYLRFGQSIDPDSIEERIVGTFLPRIAERLERLKRELGEFDYPDMLAWVQRAVTDPEREPLVRSLRQKYRYALIDEFHDTDDLQWDIFKRIFVDGDGSNRLRVIGDPKQAIYAFRRADVYTYLKARRELNEHGAARVPLAKNHRSTARLIEAYNRILDQGADPPLFTGEIRYDEPARCGEEGLRAVDSEGRDIPPVTLFRYVPPEGGKGSADSLRRTMALRIAHEVRALLNDSDQTLRIENVSGPPRSLNPREVFILTRTNEESRQIGVALREAGVHYAFYKLEGLFQTAEALDVRDVLKAIEAPSTRARRLQAWASPFFAVPWKDLPRCRELPGTHPLHERLNAWKALAERRDFARLFDSLLHDTGLTDRELFLSNSEREITNYQHIFEILLEESIRRRFSLEEVIALLHEFIGGRRTPPGVDGNVQRLESERDAVQIMTIHKSKGLEADVVFLYCLSRGRNVKDKVRVYHEGLEQRVLVSQVTDAGIESQIKKERAEEDQRLIYVSLTRARVKLYLPYVPPRTTKQKQAGVYGPLNDRLLKLASAWEREAPSDNLFKFEPATDPGDETPVAAADLTTKLASWRPPPDLLREMPVTDHFATLRKRHRPLTTESYTSLGRGRTSDPAAIDPDEFREDLDDTEMEEVREDLPGGRHMGRFLHEVIEALDFETLRANDDFDRWRELDEIKSNFEERMRLHQIEPRWREQAQRLVFDALRTPVRLAKKAALQGLYLSDGEPEIEFLYPIPEASHPLLSGSTDGSWKTEQGYLKGFIDYTFTHEGLTYFADWKSDRLPSYGSKVLEKHVELHYMLQARIYALGIVRLLGIRTSEAYDARFGGLLYLFLRGMTPGGNDGAGVYYRRPDWNEIKEYERGLMDLNVLREGTR